ncbi:MAG: hypothetical protein ABWY25_11780 [Paenisporosarcina sp.]
MKIVDFTDDQMLTLLEYLETQRDAGYNIEDVIEGIKDGSITRVSNNLKNQPV